MSSLVRSVVRIHLIGPIVSVSLICLVIGIMQICPVIQLCFGMCFSWYLSHNQPPFWTEKSPRTLLRAWTTIIRKTALHATKQTRRKNTFSGSILWCKASKQQGDNDSQPANCFLNSIMRIWLESIVSRIYIFFYSLRCLCHCRSIWFVLSWYERSKFRTVQQFSTFMITWMGSECNGELQISPHVQFRVYQMNPLWKPSWPKSQDGFHTLEISFNPHTFWSSQLVPEPPYKHHQ